MLVTRFPKRSTLRTTPRTVFASTGFGFGALDQLVAEVYNTLRSNLGTDVCPSCHRIIYASEALEAPAQK